MTVAVSRRASRNGPPGRPRVGRARPSQLMYTYGIGSQVDLPNISVVVAGLDGWDNPPETVREPRLLAAVRSALGPQVERLAALPWKADSRSPFDEANHIGVPVLPFPRWMRCSACEMLSSIEQFELKPDLWRPERTRIVHTSCPKMRKKPPLVVPARFVVACKAGHLDDFPWVGFVHRFAPCAAGAPSLRMHDTGSGTRSTEILVECLNCGKRRGMQQLFGRHDGRPAALPPCRGRDVHLRRFETTPCSEIAEPVLLGASNLWFAETRSAFALPSQVEDELKHIVSEHWDLLEPVASREILSYALQSHPVLAPLREREIDAVLAAIEDRRRTAVGDEETGIDLKRPEWERFTDPAATICSDEFEIGSRAVPRTFAQEIEAVVAASRLREVIAFIGFARIEAPDSGVLDDIDAARSRVAIAEKGPFWVPAAEVRGEGVFVRLPEHRLVPWVAHAEQSERMRALRARHEQRSKRPWPGARYVLLHSLAHALINETALECGYSAASIRERIYASEPSADAEAMAGILLYTAAPDAEGTLGGLVSLAEPDTMERLLSCMLARADICASDPLCAEHLPSDQEAALHGAACHACLLIPETSCEIGNRYLDRATLVGTVISSGIGYFR